MSQRIAKRVLLLDRRLVRQPSTGKDKRYWRALPAERALGVSGSRVPTGVGNRWGQRGRPQRQYLLGKPAIGGQKNTPARSKARCTGADDIFWAAPGGGAMYWKTPKTDRGARTSTSTHRAIAR